jgi:PiT family inorganic phosphate transporter
VIIDLVLLVAVAGVIYWRSRGSKVDPSNVNDDWTGSVAPAEPQPAAA